MPQSWASHTVSAGACGLSAMEPSMRAVQAVLFDAVGTLIFPRPPVADVYHAAGQRHGSRRDRLDVAERFAAAFAGYRDVDATDEAREQRRWRSIVGSVFADIPRGQDALFLELWDHFALPGSWAVFDDVAPAWADLERRGIQVGIASNFDARLMPLCKSLAPLNRAAWLFYSSAIGWPKPAPPFFQYVQQTMNVSPGEILLVGDDQVADVDGARAAGWQAVLIDRVGNGGSESALRSLDQLPALLPR
jgi:putative hydrolase of the HAD superfamily